MDEKQFKKLMVEKINEAVEIGRLPKYRYNVSVKKASWNLSSCIITTWIAGLGSIPGEIRSIFEACKDAFSGKIHFDGVREPGLPEKQTEGKSIDQIMQEHLDMIRQKQTEFLSLNPGWDV